MDLAIPSLDRRWLRFLSFKGGARELRRRPLPSPAVSDFALEVDAGKPVVVVGLGGQRGPIGWTFRRAAQELRALAGKGVLGRFGIDFVSVKEGDAWRHVAIEINLAAAVPTRGRSGSREIRRAA